VDLEQVSAQVLSGDVTDALAAKVTPRLRGI
jgi:hypothetical protein